MRWLRRLWHRLRGRRVIAIDPMEVIVTWRGVKLEGFITGDKIYVGELDRED